MKLPSEHTEQVAVVRWLRTHQIPFFAVPNGAKMGARECAKMKKEGLSPGVPDLILPTLRIAVEMKRREGGRLSKEQANWGQVLQDAGWTWIVGRGAKDAIKKIKEAMG